MLACVNERSPKTLQKFSCDKVIFKNVQKKYRINHKFSVEYILTPKTETSSKDYVGIYQRDWKELTEVVTFEHTITPPSEEPSLYRCIEFDCRSHLCKVLPNQDYQFVYVSQYCEVLGRSNYFQFKSDKDQEASWNDSLEFDQDNSSKENLSNVGSINLTPEEIAYNQCFFRDEPPDSSAMSVDVHQLPEISSKPVDLASNSQFVSHEHGTHTSDLINPLIPKRGRPLVKTRESGFFDVRNIVTPSPPAPQHRQNSFLNNNFYVDFGNGQNPHHFQGIHCPAPFYVDSLGQAGNKHWTFSTRIDRKRQGKWKCEHNSSPQNAVSVYVPLKNESKRGAVPKKCPKCRAPSNFGQQQQLMQHELDQARDEIRDLKGEIERLKYAMELAKAGQAKLRVSAEMARKEGRYAITFLNNLMYSLINQYRTKIVNFDNTVMYVTREIQSPGWLVPRNTVQTLVCGRPSIVKMVSGRDKELKAIIGQQELKIRDLHSRLVMANKIIDKANLLNLNLDFCISEVDQILDTPQMTPRLDDAPSDSCTLDESLSNSSSFDLADLGQVLHRIDDGKPLSIKSDEKKIVQQSLMPRISTVADVHCTEVQTKNTPLEMNPSLSHSVGWSNEVALHSEFYPSVKNVPYEDQEKLWNHQSVMDHSCKPSGHLLCNPNETNNNTINAGGSVEASETLKCGVCSPGSIHNPESTE